MATERPIRAARPALYRGFESEPSDEWREDYGRGGPVRSDEPERDWFFENSAAPAREQESAALAGRRTNGVRRASETGRHRGGPRRASELVSYRGRGPQGYRPRDERIQELICERLTEDSRIDATDLGVKVDTGIVTISGSVPTQAMRTALQGLLGTVHGIVGVRNDVCVSIVPRA